MNLLCRPNLFLLTTLFLAIMFSNCNGAEGSPWRADYENRGGITLSYQGIPVINKSTFSVVKPGWKGYFFNQSVEEANVQKGSDGTIFVTNKNDYFQRQLILRSVNPETFEIHFRGELLRDVSSQMELNLGYFNANLIANRRFTGVKKGTNETVNGHVPTFPTQVQQSLSANDLLPGFESLTFDSRLGKMTLTVQSSMSNHPLFADARNYRHLSESNPPSFWIGWLDTKPALKVNQAVEATLTIRIDSPKNTELHEREHLSFSPSVTAVSDAIDLSSQSIKVIPKPKKMELVEHKHFAIKKLGKWSVVAPEGETRLVSALEKMLDEEWNLELSEPRNYKSTFETWSGVYIGNDKLPSFPASVANNAWARHDGSYRLTVNRDGILIMAPSAQGVFYGIQTLAQLIRKNGEDVSVPFVTIEDWPTLQFRGAHWTPTRSLGISKKLIHVAARYKLNYVVFDLSRMRWKFAPEISSDIGVTSNDLRELAELCRSNFIEPIPLLNGPGHAEWMFRNGHNHNLREDSNSDWAYSVNNPKANKLMQKAMNELVEAMAPRYFHIGSDEFALKAKVPNPDNPYNTSNTTVTDLLLKSIELRNNWLNQHNIEGMLWGDMFLSKKFGQSGTSAENEEIGLERRDALPKNMIVVDWDYSVNNEDYPAIKAFQEQGLKVITASWFRPLNIYNSAQAAIRDNAWGLLQTTWATALIGENGLGKIQTVENRRHMFNAWIIAADYSWSGRKELPQELPYDAAARFIRTYDIVDHAPQKGLLLDLSKTARVKANDWLGLGPGEDLSEFYRSKGQNISSRLQGIEFRLSPGYFTVLSSAPQAMAPNGSLASLTVNVDARTKSIAFLHTSLWQTYAEESSLTIASDKITAKCIVEYQDGTKSEVDFIDGANIASWDAPSPPLSMRAWKGQTPSRLPVCLSIYKWKNPHPQKVIKNLKFQPIDDRSGYALAAVTLIQ